MKAQIQQSLESRIRPAGRADLNGVVVARDYRRSDNLSPREFEVARLICRGLSNKEIASILGISPHTVSTHIRRIYSKFGLKNRVQLASFFGGTWPPRATV